MRGRKEEKRREERRSRQRKRKEREGMCQMCEDPDQINGMTFHCIENLSVCVCVHMYGTVEQSKVIIQSNSYGSCVNWAYAKVL